MSDPGHSTVSAGEAGLAEDGSTDAGLARVVVGEIPDAADPSRMRWTARCSLPMHGLLGTFEERTEAEAAKARHLLAYHDRQIPQ